MRDQYSADWDVYTCANAVGCGTGGGPADPPGQTRPRAAARTSTLARYVPGGFAFLGGSRIFPARTVTTKPRWDEYFTLGL